MKNLLITGGAGFIGSNFVHYWINRHDDQVTVLDALTYAGNRKSIEEHEDREDFSFVHGDICDEKLVNEIIDAGNIDTVIHFAAESHVDRSIHGPDPFINTNIVGTHCLLKAARDCWSRKGMLSTGRFHHVSTDEVYGSLEPEEAAFEESRAYDPRSPYSASKAASDHLMRAYHHTYGLNITISNCSNNYGPYHFPEKLIPLAILNLLFGKSIPVYGDGANIRDWLYVEDHCRAIELILRDGKSGQTYNIGGRAEMTNMQVVELICRTVDDLFNDNPALKTRFPQSPPARGESSTSMITFVKDRPGHDRRYAMNIDKISSELGFLPGENFSSGIRKTVLWYIDNEQWWSPILNFEYADWIKKQYG